MKLRFIALLLMIAGTAGAQVNLNTTIPAPQVKGIVQPVNGGLGIDSSNATGCPKVTAGVWTISPSNCGGTSVPLTITSFAGCAGNVQLGSTITSPAFTASYSTTPSSAAITNSDGISSPTNLTTPYTSATITGSFTHSTVTTTTFTLTAVGSSTQTATCTDTWVPAIFGGVGTPGASSTVTATGTTAVLSTADVLPRAQLGAETAGSNGTVLGPFSPNNQVFYLLLTGGSHTFVDNASGFTIPFNAPIAVTFVNSNGASVNMFLYGSVNPSGPGITTSIKIAS